jgi:hypothetical protein
MYGVSDGEYAGQTLCYSCTTGLVEANVAAVGAFKEKTKRDLIIIAVGAALGAIIGVASGGVFGLIIGMGVGGSILTALKGCGYMARGAFKAATGDGLSDMMTGLFMILLCPFKTIKKIASVSWQWKKAADILSSDSQVLEAMRDYYAYTQAMEKADDAKSFDTLTAEGGELFGNSYANRVKANGEKAAQAELRKSVVQIAANGEIIRSFEPAEKSKKAA